MFIVDLSPTFWAPVRFEVQREDGTGRDLHEFDVQYPRMDEQAHAELDKRITDEKWSDRQTAAHLMQGWRNVASADKTPLAFTAENVQRVLAIDGVPRAVIAGYHAARAKAALGN